MHICSALFGYIRIHSDVRIRSALFGYKKKGGGYKYYVTPSEKLTTEAREIAIPL